MSPQKKTVGRYRGFLDSLNCLETSCFPVQTRNRTAAPSSKAKVDHSLTAPNADTAKIKRTHRPTTSTHCRMPGSRSHRRSTSIESVISATADDVNLTLPIHSISPLA